ncbi:hypothetical protein [Nocardioides aurantiacus]|uniref:Uncharacterized protein n=1 Tax=Nocardioides aurantiacus TaxID=86796 RepID=A0A3N2CYW5_9ACTN|nr:hypothetical protein [Nocardioides aurantiacus]ROR92727.1 hypothetical protein EDD33_3626 [Nocardioides aurantiacus]
MARRRLVWHLGLPQAARPVIPATLEHHADALGEAGVRVVATREEAGLATHELLRTHRDAELARRDVEGRWARICDRVWEHRGTSVVSTPDLGAADKDQLRLALDPLIGVEVHLVLTLDAFSAQLYGSWLAALRRGSGTGWEKYAARVLDHATGGAREHRQGEDYWAGHELGSLVARWAWTLHHDRVHVVADRDPARQWAGVVRELRLGEEVAARLPVRVPAYADPAGVAVLRRVNRQLDAPLARAGTGLVVPDAADAEAAAMPTVPTDVLAPLVERWRTTLEAGGYDLQGDLLDLLDAGEPTTLPGARDQLAVAVDALGDALADNTTLRARLATLEAEVADLDRKRRKWKRRAAGVGGVGA